MLRRFLRAQRTEPASSEPDEAQEPLPLYHHCCREIHKAYLACEEGTLEREAYLERKLVLLRTAVRDAEEHAAGERLLGFMDTLRLACAVNDVEVESVRSHFGA